MAETGNYYLDNYGKPDIGGAVPPTPVPDEMLKATGNYYLDTFGKPEFEAAKPTAPEGDYGWGISTAFMRGLERLKSLPDVAQGDYEELAAHFQKMDEYDLSPEDQKRMEELQNTEGWWDAAAYYFKNPALIAQVVAESLPMSTAPLAGGIIGGVSGTVVGGPPGMIIGTMAGAGAGSFLTEYLASITDYFGREGIDASDPEQLKQAFENDQLMSEARVFASDRGIPIAAFDALSFGLAGRIYKPASSLIKGATGKTIGMTGEIVAQAGAGMGGEAGAQYGSVGELEDIPGIIAEGFGEIVPGLAEQGVNRFMRGRQDQVTEDSLSGQLQKDLTDEEFGRLDAGEDVLSMQATMMGPVKEQIQTRQFQELAEARAAEDAAVEAAEAGAEVALQEDAQRSQDFLRMEQERDMRIERQRQEAEFQQELQKGKAAEDRGVTMEDVAEAKKPAPAVTMEKALVEAGVAKPTEISEPTEKIEPAEVKKAKTDPRLIDLVTQQTAAQMALEAKPNLNARRRLKKATAAVKDYVAGKEKVIEEIPLPGEPGAKLTYGQEALTQEELEGVATDEQGKPLPGEPGAEPTYGQEALTQKELEAVPVEAGIPTAPELEAEVSEAATSPKNDLPQPTKAQKSAGNYKMAHVEIKGLPITIENPVGSMRRGFKMKDHYGYVKRTEGADGDQVDVFVNPNIQTDYDNKVYVIDQTTEDGVTFDEHKVMLGYANQLDAVRAYKRNYEKGWHVGPVTEMTVPKFKRWLAGDTKTAIQGKPSRQARKFVRTQKGVRYSIPKARKALQDDAKTQVPGADQAWVEKVIGKPTGKKSDPAVQKLVTRAIEMEEQRAEGRAEFVTKEIAEKAIAPLNRELGGMQAQVHESIEEMPDSDIKTALLAEEGAKPRAVYNILTDEVHVFAGRFRNQEDVVKAALHEGVAHKGLRVLYSKTAPSGTVVLDTAKFNKLMLDVFDNATNKKLLQKLRTQYAEDPTNLSVRDKLIIGEEYLAEMAESNIQPNLLKRIVAVIRQQLRRFGVKDWTDNDIHSLLAEARGALKDARPISDIALTEEVQLEETGEVFDVETNAEVALRQHDKRTEVVKKLRACL